MSDNVQHNQTDNEGGCQCGRCRHLAASLNIRIDAIEVQIKGMSTAFDSMSKSVDRFTNAVLGDEQMGVKGYGRRLEYIERDMGSMKAFKSKVIAWAGAISATTSAVIAFAMKFFGFFSSGK